MQSHEIDQPTPSLVGWARTARPVTLPCQRPATRAASIPEVEPVDDTMFGASVFAILIAFLGAPILVALTTVVH